jgi:hypothetical protein
MESQDSKIRAKKFKNLGPITVGKSREQNYHKEQEDCHKRGQNHSISPPEVRILANIDQFISL